MTPERKALFNRFFKFGVVGFSGVFVNLAFFELAFWTLSNAGLEDANRVFVANIFGIIVSIFTNFLLNDSWTWGDRAKTAGTKAWIVRVFKYYAAASVAAAVQLGVTYISFKFLYDALPTDFLGHDVGPALSVMTGIVFGMVFNFLAGHFWAFKDDDV